MQVQYASQSQIYPAVHRLPTLFLNHLDDMECLLAALPLFSRVGTPPQHFSFPGPAFIRRSLPDKVMHRSGARADAVALRTRHLDLEHQCRRSFCCGYHLAIILTLFCQCYPRFLPPQGRAWSPRPCWLRTLSHRFPHHYPTRPRRQGNHFRRRNSTICGATRYGCMDIVARAC